MSTRKHIVVLEFNQAADGLTLKEIRDIVSLEGDETISRSRELPKNNGKAIPVVDIDASPKTLIIKLAGTTSAVITLR